MIELADAQGHEFFIGMKAPDGVRHWAAASCDAMRCYMRLTIDGETFEDADV
jgi:hypothetical protein